MLCCSRTCEKSAEWELLFFTCHRPRQGREGGRKMGQSSVQLCRIPQKGGKEVRQATATATPPGNGKQGAQIGAHISPPCPPLLYASCRVEAEEAVRKNETAMIYKQTRAINSCGGRWKKRKKGGGWIPGGEVKMESAEGTKKGVFRNGRSAKTGGRGNRSCMSGRRSLEGRDRNKKKGKRAVRTILSRGCGPRLGPFGMCTVCMYCA